MPRRPGTMEQRWGRAAARERRFSAILAGLVAIVVLVVVVVSVIALSA